MPQDGTENTNTLNNDSKKANTTKCPFELKPELTDYLGQKFTVGCTALYIYICGITNIF